MTAGSRRDDEDRPGDALDEVIDDALGSALRAETVDLRERVLARLDEPAEAQRPWLRFVFRPALLPAAGAVLLAVGVLLTWQHVDGTLARIGARRPATSAARAGAANLNAARANRAAAPTPGSSSGAAPTRAATASPSPTRVPGYPAAPMIAASRPVPVLRAATATRPVLAASVPGMDTTSAPGAVGAATVIEGDDSATAPPPLPGAMGGDLGDPIKPIPPICPIAIPPIVVAPLVEALPVSTLSDPSATVPTVGEISRDPSGPGKSGGERP